MENIRLLFQIYYRPAFAFSEIMDKGSWLFAAAAVLVVSFVFQYAVNTKIAQTYLVSQPGYSSYEIPGIDENLPPAVDGSADQQIAISNPPLDTRAPFPVIGENIRWFFSFDASFFSTLINLSLFYFPATLIILSLFGSLGNAGVVLRQDYGVFATCALMAWCAAHLPFAIAAVIINSQPIAASLYLGFWVASGLLFAGFLVVAMRTVFGVEYGPAIATVATSWIFYSLGSLVSGIISPWLFSPFLLFFAIIYLGGYLGSEVRGLGNSMKQKRNLKRFLQNATINPNDADAHLQLGLIYKKRRQNEKALEHFQKAYEIDNEEIDANYELGIVARTNGNLQEAIGHFSVVVEQNEKYSLSEIWREIGATYLEAEMYDESRSALDKFVLKRPFDAEGLYYLGTLLKKLGETAEAEEKFSEVIDAVKSAPYYRKHELQKWSRLAKKEL